MAIRTANTVGTLAISRIGSKAVNPMTHEQFEREKNYRVALLVAESMLRQGLITDQEYHEIDTILTEKYRPIFGGLCA
jgi:hypothetical protein